MEIDMEYKHNLAQKKNPKNFIKNWTQNSV